MIESIKAGSRSCVGMALFHIGCVRTNALDGCCRVCVATDTATAAMVSAEPVADFDWSVMLQFAWSQ